MVVLAGGAVPLWWCSLVVLYLFPLASPAWRVFAGRVSLKLPLPPPPRPVSASLLFLSTSLSYCRDRQRWGGVGRGGVVGGGEGVWVGGGAFAAPKKAWRIGAANKTGLLSCLLLVLLSEKMCERGRRSADGLSLIRFKPNFGCNPNSVKLIS